MTLIKIKRADAFPGKFRRYAIWLNNKKIAHIGNAQEKTIEVPPGTHRLCVRCFPFGKSPEVSFTVQAEQELLFETGVIRSERKPTSRIGMILMVTITISLYKLIAKTLGFYTYTPLILVGLFLGILVWSIIYYRHKETLYLHIRN